MTEVPKLRQRIAGKSIPLEKFVARKSRKCEAQGGRLVLPALELAYILHAVARAPRLVIVEQMLPLVEAALVELGRYEASPETYGNGSEYWDDWCLARHLEGACLRYIAYPVRADNTTLLNSFIFSHDGWLIFLRRVLMPLWTQTRPCRFLRRKLRSGLVPRSSPCSRTGPELNSITMSCISPVSAESTSLCIPVAKYGRRL